MVKEVKSYDVYNIVPNNNLNYVLRHSKPFYIQNITCNYILNNPINRICTTVNKYFNNAENIINFNKALIKLLNILKVTTLNFYSSNTLLFNFVFLLHDF